MIDFGTAKNLNEEKRSADLFKVKQTDTVEMDPDYEERKHRSSFVGTAQYVSPEMLDDSDCGIPGDLWALGNLLSTLSC
jgi:3-phosphoinositide dependent protein kinase-1